MPSRSRSRKSSRSSAKSSFRSASILKQPLDREDTPSNTVSRDEIELVPCTSQPRPSDPQSPSATFIPTNIATTEASTSNIPPVDDPPLESHSQGESVGVHINSTACGQHDRRGQPAQGGFPMNYKQKYPEDPIYGALDAAATRMALQRDSVPIFLSPAPTPVPFSRNDLSFVVRIWLT